MVRSPDEPTQPNVPWLLSRAALRAHHVVNETFAPTGLRKLHYIVLSRLRQHTAATQAELCRATGIDRSDMVALLNDLEQEGYVRRAPDPDNRRRNIVTLTADGRAILRRLDELATKARETLLAPLTAAERERFTRYLQHLVDGS